MATVALLEFMRSGTPRAWIEFVVAAALGFGTNANFICQALMLLVLAGALAWPLRGQMLRRGAAIVAATWP